MKKIIFIAILAAISMLWSCEDMLNVASKTSVTNEYLYSTTDGLHRAIIGLYIKQRDGMVNDEICLYNSMMLDLGTDIVMFRAGQSADLARLDTFSPTSGNVSLWWLFNYGIIGSANEIIAGANSLGADSSSELKYIRAEAKMFRARAYFELYKRYENVYLNTEPTTIDNVERTYTPASKEELFALINSDLDEAIDVLDWQVPDDMYGRFNKAVAKHVKAQVAMWQQDWDTAIEECEDIFTTGSAYYGMENKIEAVFSGENLRSKEVLFSYQFSKNTGGGGTLSGTSLVGHVVPSYVTAGYRKIAGCVLAADQGGYGWGRIYPNTYLLSLYDQSRDTRYQKMYQFTYYYNDPDSKYTSIFGNAIVPEQTNYVESLHPMCLKQADFWTNQDQPDRKTSFRDLIVYRLAETYLMASEAYFHKEGGASTNALAYFNKTWERAGNTKFTGTLTLDMLLDEYARELNFEGVRWSLLKRLGLLGERVKLHSGDSVSEDALLDMDYTQCRSNFVIGKHEVWPIPENQLLLMGDTFPQNEQWR